MLLRRISLAAGLLLAFQTSSIAIAQEGGPKPEELFQSLDKNGDGKLTADEVTSEQKRFFERSLRIGDKDGDGVLTKEEFVAASREPENPSQPLAPLGGGPREGMGDPKQRFEMMDRNKDGKLTLDEFPEPIRERMKPMFERLGKDSLTLEEFSRFGGPMGRPQLGGDVGQLFERFDANSDGKVTREEIPEPLRERFNRAFEAAGKAELTRDEFQEAARRAMAEGGRPGPDGRPGGPAPGMEGGRGRGPALFGMLDTDGDGHLTKDELAKIVDKFSELDTNQDGRIDPAELFGPPPGGPFAGGPGMPGRDGRPAGRPEGRPGDPAGGPNPFFARMDANGDGKISKDEAPERLKENFDRMDRDGDGFLTQEELRGAFERRGGQPPEGRRPEGPRPEGQPGQGENPRPRRPPAE